MSDLVGRLRAPETVNDRGPNYMPIRIPPSDLCLEAAAEITRLRALVDEYREAEETRKSNAIAAAEADISRLISSHDAFDCPDNMTFVRAANLIAADIVERFGRLATLEKQHDNG